ncbi:methylmalonyl-CoA mutase [Cytobacillus eiseniae]|uniref:methylmalonyl-CoA mutase n=1 Tax=Cytobacillus eiseniae TaxID=762947 RepID=A0ABS4RD37_9BACI|nr:methylmalonyl-CoA mutase family protein [Cytobacillus eiseniae]MBP2240802.1 methylmalonyl-CoA mutase [Cytobacillus eiseniae]
MTLNKMMNETFEEQTLDAWKQKAEETLKGKPVESLSKITYENIQLKPLYSKETVDQKGLNEYPGYPDFRRGSEKFGNVSDNWKIAQKLRAENAELLREKLLQAIDRGQTAISLCVEGLPLSDMDKLIAGIYTNYPFCIDTDKYQNDLLNHLAKLADAKQISGYIAADPVAGIILNRSASSLTEIYDKWVTTIQLADQSMPKLRTILIDTTVYHNGGANAVQELAISLATGVHHIQQLIERGIRLETILSKMVFKFSIGANFFMEIAKLRAARLLWGKVAEAYGAKPEDQKMVISAETSSFTKTAYDPYVNILRAGNESFAAVLGGIQYLHVSPFNDPEGNSTPFSERIARNTQLILKEEAHLKNIIDPAGGSWYVESITNDLAVNAWELFLQMEEKNGIVEALSAGWLQEQIAEVMEKRKEDIFTRKQSLIGTNIYANLADKPLQNVQNDHGHNLSIPQVRLSEPFEKLRRAAEQMEQSGIHTKVGLICLGELKEHKTRADFMTGFLTPGGIQAVKSLEIEQSQMAINFIEETQLNHYVICGTNKQYGELALSITRLIKEKNPNIKVFLAGLPEASQQEELNAAGIERFIHVKSNCYEILAILLNEMEVAINE